MVVADHKQSFLKNIIAKLIIDQLLDNEVHSGFEVCWFARFEAELLDYLVIVIWEGAFENLINMGFLNWFIEFWIKTFLNDIAWELELTQSDKILGNLLKNAFISLLVFQLEDVLHKIVPIRVFD